MADMTPEQALAAVERSADDIEAEWGNDINDLRQALATLRAELTKRGQARIGTLVKLREAEATAETLRAKLADMREELDATIEQRDLLSQEVLRLAGELDGLRADARRYRYAVRCGLIFLETDKDEVDAAIDAARQESSHSDEGIYVGGCCANPRIESDTLTCTTCGVEHPQESSHEP